MRGVRLPDIRYMSLKETLQKDLNESLKAKEELRSSVLRLLLAAILNKEKEKRFKLKKEEDTPLTDEEIVDVISSEIKKRKEAAGLYIKGARPELAEKEKKEAEILQKYLPEQISEDEIKKIIKEAVIKTGGKEIKDMGKVMSAIASQIKGKADMGLVSKIVKELLTNG